MFAVWRRLWRAEQGEVHASSYLLLVTIVVLGSIVGLASFRDAIVNQLGDLAVSLERLDQSFTSVNGTFTDTSPYPVNGSIVGTIAPAAEN